MELLGENHFKVAAFRKAASILELDTRSLAEMDDILSLKGIGKGTGAVIIDLMEKGTSDALTELEEKVPKGLIPLLDIPGLGGKKIAKLREALNIDSIESLQAACERQEVSKVPGFGKKTEENLLREIEILAQRSGKTPIWQVAKVVDIVQAELELIDEIQKYQVAGSHRRREEESSDVDWILVTEQPQIVREKILAALPIEKVIAAGDAKLSISLDTEHPIDADFRFVTEDQFATALHHFTGSAAHNIRMRQLAKSRKQKISEYGVEDEAVLHNQALQEVLEKIDPVVPEHILIDQFAQRKTYFNYLKDESNIIRDKVLFSTKAENLHVSVATASILARVAFLEAMDQLSIEAGVTLPKGAGPRVDQVACQIIRKKGEPFLHSITKVHFANTQKALKLVYKK